MDLLKIAAGATVEMNTTPFFEGGSAIVVNQDGTNATDITDGTTAIKMKYSTTDGVVPVNGLDIIESLPAAVKNAGTGIVYLIGGF